MSHTHTHTRLESLSGDESLDVHSTATNPAAGSTLTFNYLYE